MADKKSPVSFFWFRRDLRLHDNHGLFRALEGDHPVVPLFIFDRTILEALEDRRDARVQFLWQEIKALKEKLEQEYGATLVVRYGYVPEVWESLREEYEVKEVFTNRDYEPYGRDRDKALYNKWENEGPLFRGFKDQVLLEKNDVLKGNGQPYVVFTPYMRKYKSLLSENHFEPYPSMDGLDQMYQQDPASMPSLEDMGFESFPFEYPGREVDEKIIRNYAAKRDIPAVKGTSRLSMHLRFGTLSVREVAKKGKAINPQFFNEIIWRDFYQAILYHFPKSLDHSFKPEYDNIEWENNIEHFEAWCAGKTGYPLVDAGMRELNETGWMHNRMRMLTASFLTKHLLIDWRWGERYFARLLLDYEAGSNVGGWQWAAGSGVDAAPYFRIFSPSRQQERFDSDYAYVKRWVPEFDTDRYPEPIVEHKWARQRALDRYKEALG